MGMSVTWAARLRRANHLEHGVLLSQCAILRLVAAALRRSHTRVRSTRKPLARAKEGRGWLAVRLGARRGGRHAASRHPALESRPSHHRVFWVGTHPADKEGSEPFEMKRRLAGLSHPLNDDRKLVQLRPRRPYDEVVVEVVEPVTSKPGCRIREPARPSDVPTPPCSIGIAFCSERERLFERASSAQRGRRWPISARVQDGRRGQSTSVSSESCVPDRIVAALKHRVRLGLRAQSRRTEATAGSCGAPTRTPRCLAQREQRNAVGSVGVLVERAVDTGRLESRHERRRVVYRRRHRLHVEPAVERRRLALDRAPMLGDVGALDLLLLGPVVDACLHVRSWSHRAASLA